MATEMESDFKYNETLLGPNTSRPIDIFGKPEKPTHDLRPENKKQMWNEGFLEELNNLLEKGGKAYQSETIDIRLAYEWKKGRDEEKSEKLQEIRRILKSWLQKIYAWKVLYPEMLYPIQFATLQKKQEAHEKYIKLIDEQLSQYHKNFKIKD